MKISLNLVARNRPLRARGPDPHGLSRGYRRGTGFRRRVHGLGGSDGRRWMPAPGAWSTRLSHSPWPGVGCSNLDAALAAFMSEDVSNAGSASEAGGVEKQQHGPLPPRRLPGRDEILESGPVLCLGGLHLGMLVFDRS